MEEQTPEPQTELHLRITATRGFSQSFLVEVFSETPSSPPVTYSALVDEGIEAIMLVLDIVLIVLVLFPL